MTATALYESFDVWDQNIQKGQYNLAQAILDFFPPDISTVLDVGCGDGKLTNILRLNKDCQFIGADSSEEALKRCEFETIFCDAAKLPFDPQSIDMVLSTDMLEHLNSSDENKAWESFFSIAKKWVVVAVPFDEDLLEGTSKCQQCNEKYHVNWHMRSYGIKDLIDRCPNEFEVDKVVLAGESWSTYHPYEISFRREVLQEWAGWESAMCPLCGAECTSSSMIEPLSPLISASVARVIYASDFKPKLKTHSEILILYRRKNISAPLEPRYSKAKITEFNVSKVQLDNHVRLEVNLVSFPQYPQVIKGQDGELIIQIPCYDDLEYIQFNSFKKKAKAKISIEEAANTIFVGEIETNNKKSYIYQLPSSLYSSYYGLIVRVFNFENIKDIQIGTGAKPLLLLSSSEKKSQYSYHRLSTNDQTPFFVQVLDSLVFNMDFFEPALPTKEVSPKKYIELIDSIATNKLSISEQENKVLKGGLCFRIRKKINAVALRFKRNG